MGLEANPAQGDVDGMRRRFRAEHDSVQPADGEATAGGSIPDRCSSPALQLALSAGSSGAGGAASASLQLPLLAAASRQTPTLHGAARELSPLADVPDALSLGLSAASAGHAAPTEAVSQDHPADFTACAGYVRRSKEGACDPSRGEGRTEAGERPDEYIEAPQSQTQLRPGEDAAGQNTPAASEGAPQGNADVDAAPSQRPAATAPLLESGPVLHTQLGAAQADVAATEIGGGAPAPAANTQAEAPVSAVPAGSLRLVPDSEDQSSGWHQRPAAPAERPANRLPGARVAPAADVGSSARGETGGRSTGAGSSAAPGVICAMDAPRDSLGVAPVMHTQHGAAHQPACAEVATPASIAAGLSGRKLDGSEVAVTPMVEGNMMVPARVATGLNEPVGSADQPSAQRTVSGPASATEKSSQEGTLPVGSSGLPRVEAASKPDSIGDRTTEVTTSPDKLPRSSSAHDDGQANVRPDPPRDTHAQHVDAARKPAADAAELLQPPAQRSASLEQAVCAGDVGTHACGSDMEAAGSAAVADDAADASIAAPVPDSQPADGGAAESLGPPSLPRQV